MKQRNTLAGLMMIAFLIGCSKTPEPGPAITEAVTEMPSAVTQETAPPAASSLNTSFIPAQFSAPTLVEAEGFKLMPLSPDLVEIDYKAYMSSIEHLQKTFTRSNSWPHKDISDADAMLDMEKEKARFEGRESFAYAVLTPDGTRERGSLYVRPSSVDDYDAVVTLWVTKAEYDAGFDEDLYAWAKQWVETQWPFEQVAYPGRAIEWDAWDTMLAQSEAAAEALQEQNRVTAERFIDAFYSFKPEQLKPLFTETDESADRILYYQGWAEGGNYVVTNRGTCEAESATLFRCPITVQDDPVVALKTGFNVTDTFHITFEGTSIASIETSSNDQPIYYEARKWVEENMPDVMSGPCLDRTKGGTTPGDCARAMTDGYARFYAATRGDDSSE